MFSLKTLSLLALVGSSFAAPAPNHRKRPAKVVVETIVHTVYQTVTPGYQPTPAPQPEQPKSKPQPKPSSKVVIVSSKAPEPVVTPTPTPEPAPVVTPTPEPEPVYTPTPTPSKAPEPAPSAPATGGYMGTVNEWRAKLGLKDLQHDAKLEQNALKTAREGNGKMVHQLNPGSFGQVLAPGKCQDSEFFHVFVGGWLCEKPNMPGMDGICATASEGWYYTSTGHADLLTSDNYAKIACGCEGGIWACDLA